ncbi:hypothetical protein D521_1280 [beta proteobacterium CB]|uniref:hypothetical protein n=1 Tax=Polynucleobacter sp. 71A-WALBACH TaxID=2689097 RepID=UPI0002B8406E|nr:hypothetical protein [Polynucleobacter sp. 71A-WALBACH]AGG33848.1 hypothetical protein D521_1280 [beta proteobacterium CB]
MFPFPSLSLNFGNPKILALSTNTATASGLEISKLDLPLGETCNGSIVINTSALVSI